VLGGQARAASASGGLAYVFRRGYQRPVRPKILISGFTEDQSMKINRESLYTVVQNLEKCGR
jgi:hypothetical protein